MSDEAVETVEDVTDVEVPVEDEVEADAVEDAEEVPVEDEVEAVADQVVVEPEPDHAGVNEVTEAVVYQDPGVNEVDPWQGWTVQSGGLPAVPEPEKINAVTPEQLPVAEEFAKNGGSDEALALVNVVSE